MSKEETFGIVFKQRYQSVNLKSTPVLNAKHLIYIATRPGAVFNKDCSFGLFGKISNMESIDNINNLEYAKKELYRASKRRTVYRAVFSLPHKDALEKGYYQRDMWQRLLCDKIKAVAKEMNINEKDFKWMASFHCEMGHPHVHVMYWDNGQSIRQEYIPKECFEILAEKIRAEFNRGIYSKELDAERRKRDKAEREMLSELRSVFIGLNIIEPFMTWYLTNKQISEIEEALTDVLKEMPVNGVFRYQYLKPQTKEAVDRFVKTILEVPKFFKAKTKYINAGKEIGRIYGNSEETIKHNVEKSEKDLYNELGNILLKHIKENRLEYVPTYEDLECEYKDAIDFLECQINESVRSYKLYHEILTMFPKHRTPIREFADDAFREKLYNLVNEVVKSEEVLKRVNHLVNNSVKFRLWEIEIENFAGSSFDWKERKKYAKDFNREEYKKIWSETYKMVFDRLYKDTGYVYQYRRDITIDALRTLFGALTQIVNFEQSKNDYAKLMKRRGELSKEARRDKMVQRESSGDWEPEL